MRARWALTLAALAAGIGCAPDFPKRSEIFDLRILALQASPLEAGPGEQVRVGAVAVAPEGVTVTGQRWTFCPFSLGSVAGYSCAVAACETDLVPAPDGTVTAEPYALALACAALVAAGGGAPPTGGSTGTLPTSIEVLFRYEATASDGVVREAVLRLPLYRDPVPWLPPYPLGLPWDRNLPPAFLDPAQPVTIGGKKQAAGGTADPLAPGGKVEVCAPLDPASAQSYRGASGELLTESLTVSFYSTAGRFDFDRASGPDFCAKLEAKELNGATEALLWVVARDLRGGQVVAGPFTVPFR